MDNAQMVLAKRTGAYHRDTQVSHLQKTNILILKSRAGSYYPK